MDPPNDLGGDKGHVQDQYELGPRSFGPILEEPHQIEVLTKINPDPHKKH